MITHIYHGNLGQILDDDGKVLPVVRDAERRGVLFDLGFGSYNFAWSVAEKSFAQGIIPHTISSDLQQFNVIRPVKSLANVLTAMLRVGLSLQEVMARVTANPARALSLTDRAGSLKPGLPADITIFRVESGAFEISDCYKQVRTADRQIVPVIAFKAGKRFDCDLGLGQDESNWFLQFAEDHVPRGGGWPLWSAARIPRHSGHSFVSPPIGKCRKTNISTSTKRLKCRSCSTRFVASTASPCGTPCSPPTTVSSITGSRCRSALLLVRLDKSFAVERLRQVAGKHPMAA